MSDVKQVVRHALFSRCVLFVLQAFVNVLFEDFDSSTWNKNDESFWLDFQHNKSSSNNNSNNRYGIDNGSTMTSRILFGALNGINKWDSVYMNHISIHGHTYEQMLAFFPGFPYLVKNIVTLVSCLIINPQDDTSTLLLVQFVGCVLNAALFVLATLALHRLTAEITIGVHRNRKNSRRNFIMLTTYLFIWNPANVFMMSSYTESLFVFLQFASLVALEKRYFYIAAVTVAMGTLVRSNGLLSVVFLVYFFLKHKLTDEYTNRKEGIHLLNIDFVKKFCPSPCQFLKIIGLLVLSLVPFLVYQYHIFNTVCGLPHIVDAGTDTVDHWCKRLVPFSYSYVQETYWNVGLFRYYEFKQIPNFILAAPVIGIVFAGCLSLGSSEGFSAVVRTLGLIAPLTKRNDSEGVIFPPVDRMFVYACHALFLTLFGVINVHVQILTRMIFSSTPFVYWCIAQEILYGGDSCTKRRRRVAIFILSYFVFYNITGVFLHCNFYPWS